MGNCKNCNHWNFNGGYENQPICELHEKKFNEGKHKFVANWIKLENSEFHKVEFSPGPEFGCVAFEELKESEASDD